MARISQTTLAFNATGGKCAATCGISFSKGLRGEKAGKKKKRKMKTHREERGEGGGRKCEKWGLIERGRRKDKEIKKRENVRNESRSNESLMSNP